MLIAQITDCHVVAAGKRLYQRVDTPATLRAAVAHINNMTPRPDVVLATGDLVNSGGSAQYAELSDCLSELAVPLFAIPGNHDDRTEMRALFDHIPAGGPDDPIDYVVDDYPVRLVALDTIIPGRHDGEVLEAQLAWLDETLGAQPDKPTMIFQHHPPFVTGIDWMDQSGLAGKEREAEVVARHAQVTAIVCGHIHRPIQALVGGAVASTWPSTGAQVALALDGSRYHYADEPAVVAVHRWSPASGVVSHLSYVGGGDTWIPPWVDDPDAE